jgi:hypothetical protein
MPILLRMACVVFTLGLVAGCRSPHTGPPALSPVGSADPAKADAVMRVVRDAMAQARLEHFRNGAVTYAPGAFDDQGNYSNEADILFRKIGAVVAPNAAPPMPRGR